MTNIILNWYIIIILDVKLWTHIWESECCCFNFPHGRLDNHRMFSNFWTIDGAPSHNIYGMNKTNVNAEQNKKWHKLHFGFGDRKYLWYCEFDTDNYISNASFYTLFSVINLTKDLLFFNHDSLLCLIIKTHTFRVQILITFRFAVEPIFFYQWWWYDRWSMSYEVTHSIRDTFAMWITHSIWISRLKFLFLVVEL